ncbi:MAG: hypothetical protein AMJ59_11490 [Gammaproteobacteria bacterium SG8_31]|nr:MAG: hypothetical protein AMJ59_11490 [Gammaproteobacteria bacterium SG8_31]
MTQVTVHDRTRARWRIGKSLLYWQDATAAVSVRAEAAWIVSTVYSIGQRPTAAHWPAQDHRGIFREW